MVSRKKLPPVRKLPQIGKHVCLRRHDGAGPVTGLPRPTDRMSVREGGSSVTPYLYTMSPGEPVRRGIWFLKTETADPAALPCVEAHGQAPSFLCVPDVL